MKTQTLKNKLLLVFLAASITTTILLLAYQFCKTISFTLKKDSEKSLNIAPKHKKAKTNPFSDNQGTKPSKQAITSHQPQKEKESFAEFISNHPYTNRKIDLKTFEKIPKKDRPDLAMELEFLKTVDPQLGYVPSERLQVARQKIKQFFSNKKKAINGVKWEERGPNNVGGRTRALLFDPNDASYKKVWAGGVAGGLWFNNDITDANSSWQKIDDFWSNLAISCIAFDPGNKQIFYVATGEGFGNGDSVRGEGIWKTSDGGVNWVQLSSTKNVNFQTVRKLVVNNSGIVLASASGGIYRSSNKGTSWSNVVSGSFSDIEIAANGDIYAGEYDGDIHKSTNGGQNWVEIDVANNGSRVEIACAPSNNQVIYAISNGGAGSTDIAWFKKSVNGGTSWTDLTIPLMMDGSGAHFTRGQGWYDLILAVHPTNPNIVLTGGIDLHKSIDGGTTWSGISHWYGGFGEPYVHADQHAITFNPSNPNEAIFGNDGGIFLSNNVGNSLSPSFSSRNKDYNVTQYYACAMENKAKSNYFLAGSQDNGTSRLIEPGISYATEATGGDGAFCFIDQEDKAFQITSYVYNNYYLSTDGGFNFGGIAFNYAGFFINPADYDNKEKILYSSGNSDQLCRIRNITTAPTSLEQVSVNLAGNRITAIRADAYTANRIFVGTWAGEIYCIDNAQAASPVVTKLPGTGTNGWVSCIDIGANDNELIITYSSYGIKSVFYSNNGGNTWISKDEITHGLPDMPIRWALFNLKNTKQVLLATEMGVWSTDDIKSANPGWEPSNEGLANTRCDMLQYRKADGLVAIATHGRGLFTSDIFTSETADFEVNKNWGYIGSAFTFTDISNKATNWTWNFGQNANPATAQTKGPHSISYVSSGKKTISLTINNNTNLTKFQNNLIHILPDKPGDYSIADGGNFENDLDFVADRVSPNLSFERGNSTIAGKNGVASASNAWVTNLTGFYPPSSEAYLYSPNFNFSTSGTYTLSFKTKFRTETNYDGFIVEYSTDKGNNWTQLANVTASGWYNSTKAASGGFPTGTKFFSGTNSSYQSKSRNVSFLAGNANVAFRFVFKSDEYAEYPGVAIDDFQIVGPLSIASFSPANNATIVGLQENLIIDFSKNIQKGTGNILIKKLSDNSIFESIAVGSSQVSILDKTATINPTNEFTSETAYFIEIESGTFKDTQNNNFVGITGNNSWKFTTLDNTPPVFSLLNPENNAADISPNTNLTLTFSENIQKGTGNILIKKLSDNSIFESIEVNSNQVNITDKTASINPNNDLIGETGYFVEIEPGTCKDTQNNNFAGITGNNSWKFTTLDNTPPVFSLSNPENNAGNVSPNTNLTLTFSENIQKGTGNILIKKLNDNSIFESITISSNQVNISGKNLSINPMTDFANGTTYYVETETGIVKDAKGNAFMGFSGSNSWQFSTEISVGIEDELLDKAIQIFPNPSPQILYIESAEFTFKKLTLTLMDFTGKVLLQKTLENFNGKYSLDLSHFPSGQYFIKVDNAKGKLLRKFVKI